MSSFVTDFIAILTDGITGLGRAFSAGIQTTVPVDKVDSGDPDDTAADNQNKEDVTYV